MAAPIPDEGWVGLASRNFFPIQTQKAIAGTIAATFKWIKYYMNIALSVPLHQGPVSATPDWLNQSLTTGNLSLVKTIEHPIDG